MKKLKKKLNRTYFYYLISICENTFYARNSELARM
jgi:hypothetical protein